MSKLIDIMDKLLEIEPENSDALTIRSIEDFYYYKKNNDIGTLSYPVDEADFKAIHAVTLEDFGITAYTEVLLDIEEGESVFLPIPEPVESKNIDINFNFNREAESIEANQRLSKSQKSLLLNQLAKVKIDLARLKKQANQPTDIELTMIQLGVL